MAVELSHSKLNRKKLVDLQNASLLIQGERGLPPLTLRDPARGMDEVVLSDENKQVSIEDILEQHHRADVLRSYGLRPADKMLFCGPPGCGKTLTAEVAFRYGTEPSARTYSN